MTEFDLFDAGDEPAGTDDFDNAELVQWASHSHHADTVTPGASDEVSGASGENDDEGRSSNWIRVDSPWHADGVDPYMTG